MSRRGHRDKTQGPRFPRRRWSPGQAERTQTPKKGKGSYDRGGEKRAAKDEADRNPAPPEDAGAP